MWLLLMAGFGLLVPNGLFIGWLLTEFDGIGSLFESRLALAFMLEATLLLVLLAVHFARHPPGPCRWPWFILLSLVGGLGFGLPFYYWLNTRTAEPGPVTRRPAQATCPGSAPAPLRGYSGRRRC